MGLGTSLVRMIRWCLAVGSGGKRGRASRTLKNTGMHADQNRSDARRQGKVMNPQDRGLSKIKCSCWELNGRVSRMHSDPIGQ